MLLVAELRSVNTLSPSEILTPFERLYMFFVSTNNPGLNHSRSIATFAIFMPIEIVVSLFSQNELKLLLLEDEELDFLNIQKPFFDVLLVADVNDESA